MPDVAPFSAGLTARNLAVARGGRIIVDGVDLDLAPGEAIVLRGPNGAGKTTLLRALAGLLAPAAGAIQATGERVFCGVRSATKPALTVDENLRFWARLYQSGEIESARNRLGLDDYAKRPAGHLSTGFLRRLGLARLLLSSRPLWFVDEPTSGLDKDASAIFEGIIADHRKTGGAAIIATHETLNAPGARQLELRNAEAAA
ncbi:MAG: heme ABC exporter ATP-binding protein CcmA [Pseudomonadota bacterium]